MGDSDKDLETLARTTTEDFYELLGVAFDAEESTIKKAYRKTSLQYHPDKNPDNKDAADRFIFLGWARDILIDEKLKGEYDRARARRREKKLQDELLDGQRRRMKEDLERRERATPLKRKRAEDATDEEKRLRRLAEDTERRRQEIKERRRKEQQEEGAASLAADPEPPRARKPGESPDLDRTIKIRFPREGKAQHWDKDTITTMFSKYGKIDSVVMGKDKKFKLGGSKHRVMTATAFIVYTRLDHAHAAVLDGASDYPALESVAWMNGEPDLKSTFTNTSTAPSTPVTTPRKSFRASFGPGASLGTPKFSFSPKTPSLEEVTMMRLKQAEKKRLEDQIRKQEADEDEAAVA